jgi:hypothetical protein
MRRLFALILVLLALLLVAFLLLVRPALAATRCTTYQEQTLSRLHTVCDDGTRAVSTWNWTLERWETTIMPPTSHKTYEKLPPKPRAPHR